MARPFLFGELTGIIAERVAAWRRPRSAGLPSRLVALEWDGEWIRGIEAHTGSSPRIIREFTWQRPAEWGEATAEQIGEWLKGRLSDTGVIAQHAVVVLPRDAAVVKRLDLPAVPDPELPAVVRFQAEARSAVPLSQLTYDFISLPPREGVEGRQAMLATIPQALLESIQQSLSIAGLQPLAVGLTPWSLAELVAGDAGPRTEPVPAHELLLFIESQRLEFIFLQAGEVVFAHAVRWPASEAAELRQQVPSEISRALVAARGVLPQLQLARVWCCCPEQDFESWHAQLEKRLNCPLQRLDPVQRIGGGTARAAGDDSVDQAPVIGALLGAVRGARPVLNFLAPRLPVVAPDRRRHKIAAAAVAAGLALAAVIGGMRYYMSVLDRRIDERLVEDAELDDTIRRGEPLLAAAQMVREWTDGNVYWLQELADFSERLPGTDRVYLTSLRADPQPQAIGQLKADGFAREQEDVIDLNQRMLAERERYQLRPHAINESPSDPDYPWRFEADVVLRKPATLSPAASPAAARTDTDSASPTVANSDRGTP